MKRSHRESKPNSKYFSDDFGSQEGKRKCESSGCPATHPVCFARVSDRCAGNGWTSRWYHLTLGEHYCNECFEHFYRSHKEGHKQYESWKREWSLKSRTTASLRLYMADKLLPYWVQCQRPECGKWRQLSREVDLTPEFVNNFQCHKIGKKEQHDSCAMHEDERVEFVDSSLWFVQTRCTVYLKNSLCAPFLTAYYSDGVGLSPMDIKINHKGELILCFSQFYGPSRSVTSYGKLTAHVSTKKMCPYLSPFPQENYPLHAFAVTPDMMTHGEIEFFPLFAQQCPYTYLALRNTIMVLWALNPKEWLSKEKCMHHIICRGLSRVFCVKMLPQIISYLTHCQYINVGLVKVPTDFLSPSSNTQTSVIVIGAGMSGLAAARTLHSYGYKVTVIEGRERIGGRLDDQAAGCCSHVLTGIINNPISVISFQADIPLQEINEACQLFMPDGKSVSKDVDRRIEFHYNAILDIISEWRKKKEINEDISLEKKFTEFHEEFIRETQDYFSDAEEQVIQFHLSNLEFACGCSLDQVSSLQWDHNENLPQFYGKHVTSQDGFQSLMAKLSDGLDVRLGCTVKSINYTEEKNVSVCSDIENFTADKVIITVPLGVLKASTIDFSPPLPLSKSEAFQHLGAGLIEKVTLRFEANFWAKSMKGHQMFGCVPSSKADRGLFNLFYSSSSKSRGESGHYLSAYIVGHGINVIKEKPDQEIIDLCMETLRRIFPRQAIPGPAWSHVSHWASDPFALLSFSFLPVGATAELHDVMAEDVDGKLFFAGEATSKQFPQTITGAYLSGVREAWKIIKSTSND